MYFHIYIFNILSFFAGKRWVECRNQDQISIPDQIDMETQVLDLSGNNLQILPREVFARHGLLNLQKLHLSDCKIGQIDPTAFRGLTNLVEINLAGNLLTTIPAATFSGKNIFHDYFSNDKCQIISKYLLVSSYSPKK